MIRTTRIGLQRHAIRQFTTLPVAPQKLESATTRQHVCVVRDEQKMNAPTTLPVNVDLTRQPEQSKFKYAMACGKQIVGLYKNGIKNVWNNYGAGKRLMKKYNAPDLKTLNQRILDNGFAQSIEHEAKVMKPTEDHITRSDFLMLTRTQRDIKKLPLFAVIFAVFFEFTPAIVLMFPRVTPSTCTLPYQHRKDVKAMNAHITNLKKLHTESTPKRLSMSLHQLSTQELRALVRLFYHTQVAPASLYPRSWLETKVQTHVEQVKADNVLISRYGSVGAMNSQEIERACLARAIPTTSRSEAQQRADLFLWIANFTEGRYDTGFYFYPLETTEEQAKAVNDLFAKQDTAGSTVYNV